MDSTSPSVLATLEYYSERNPRRWKREDASIDGSLREHIEHFVVAAQWLRGRLQFSFSKVASRGLGHLTKRIIKHVKPAETVVAA